LKASEFRKLIREEVRKVLKEAIIGPNSQKFIDDIQKFKGSPNQSSWMWLYKFCELLKIDYSYFDDVVKELNCKFEDIAISGERLKDWKMLNSKVTLRDLEMTAKNFNIKYVVDGYNVNDCILWNAKQ